MAVSSSAISRDVAAETPSYLNQGNLWLTVAGFTFFNLFVRWYEEVYGWSAGLDAFAPEFKTYWMTFLYTEWVLEIVFFSYIGAYLWKTRTGTSITWYGWWPTAWRFTGAPASIPSRMGPGIKR